MQMILKSAKEFTPEQFYTRSRAETVILQSIIEKKIELHVPKRNLSGKKACERVVNDLGRLCIITAKVPLWEPVYVRLSVQT
ncbi:MAG: hypothetical protein LAO78_18830 [Acidobacteriia bacterium]|nr:hypothetical protein [Terriglobia bacterium]